MRTVGLVQQQIRIALVARPTITYIWLICHVWRVVLMAHMLRDLFARVVDTLASFAHLRLVV